MDLAASLAHGVPGALANALAVDVQPARARLLAFLCAELLPPPPRPEFRPLDVVSGPALV